MNEDIQIKLSQMVSDTEMGLYGTKAKKELEKAQSYTNVIAYFIEFINDLYNPLDNDIELYQIGQRINEFLLVLYRDSKIKDVKAAKALYYSLFQDFPNTYNTNLFDRYQTLLENAICFKTSIGTSDKIVLWTISKSLFKAYNEFLNGLIGYINICAKAAIGKKYNPSVLHNSYKAKIDEFKSILLDALFPIISNIAKPEIANAISHSRISPNNEKDEIEYTIKVGNIFENKRIGLIEFIGLASAGTYIPLGYITALATIYIVENGTITDLYLLPEDIIVIFQDNLKLSNKQ